MRLLYSALPILKSAPLLLLAGNKKTGADPLRINCRFDIYYFNVTSQPLYLHKTAEFFQQYSLIFSLVFLISKDKSE